MVGVITETSQSKHNLEKIGPQKSRIRPWMLCSKAWSRFPGGLLHTWAMLFICLTLIKNSYDIIRLLDFTLYLSKHLVYLLIEKIIIHRKKIYILTKYLENMKQNNTILHSANLRSLTGAPGASKGENQFLTYMAAGLQRIKDWKLADPLWKPAMVPISISISIPSPSLLHVRNFQSFNRRITWNMSVLSLVAAGCLS